MFGHDDHDENNQHDKPQDEHQHAGQPADDVIKPSDTSGDDNWQHPGPPPSDSDNDDNEDDDTVSTPEPETPTPHPMAGNPVDNDLIDLKQEALTKLSPLVGHLDQTPDEKFRTLMMMIQASDDQGLVKQAYETALKIDDEKERAQALLDIVNEINYFTQNSATPQ